MVFLFPHRFSLQIDFVSVMYEAVEDGIRYRRIPYDLVPVFEGQLAGHDGVAYPVTVFEYLKKIPSFLVVQGGQTPVVYYKQLDSRYGVYELA